MVIFLNIRVLIAPNPFGSRRFVISKYENDFKKINIFLPLNL